MAGIAVARCLRAAGQPVVLFDKARAAGGRVATRRAEPWAFDHGAQFFTARDLRFRELAHEAVAAGAAAYWAGPFATLRALPDGRPGTIGGDPRPDAVRFVGTPGMSGFVRWLARGLPIELSATCQAMERRDDGWYLLGEFGSRGPFREVVSTLPPAQTQALLGAAWASTAVGFAAATLAAALQPCLCTMVAFAAPLPGVAGGWFVTDEVLGWVAHDGGKPGRGGAASYVLHANAAWSAARWEVDPEVWSAQMLAAFGRLFGPLVGGELPAVVHRAAHRWRYALSVEAERPGPFVHDARVGLSWCGDALVGGRVEGAFTSGADLGEYLVRSGR
jgi:predicted NAD/FAD-dependent oxidoreductase